MSLPPHPFERVDARTRRLWLVVGCVVTVGLMVLLAWLDRALTTLAAPRGIVSFELAGDLNHARAMMASWVDPSAATVSLVIDYPFLVAYSSTIALASVVVASGLGPRSRLIGRAVAWSQLSAAGLDALENGALLALIGGGDSELWPRLALYSAIPKFTLVAVGLAFVLGGTLARLRGIGASDPVV